VDAIMMMMANVAPERHCHSGIILVIVIGPFDGNSLATIVGMVVLVMTMIHTEVARVAIVITIVASLCRRVECESGYGHCPQGKCAK
jgi:hypothetical protein